MPGRALEGHADDFLYFVLFLPSQFNLFEEDYEAAIAVVEKQMVLAAVRLSRFLEAVFEPENKQCREQQADIAKGMASFMPDAQGASKLTSEGSAFQLTWPSN